MIITLPCGHTIDDAEKSTVCYGLNGHYPIGTSPATYCKRCDLFKPCPCDKAKVYD